MEKFYYGKQRKQIKALIQYQEEESGKEEMAVVNEQKDVK